MQNTIDNNVALLLSLLRMQCTHIHNRHLKSYLSVLFTVLVYRSKYAPACYSEKFTGMHQLLSVYIQDQKCDMCVCVIGHLQGLALKLCTTVKLIYMYREYHSILVPHKLMALCMTYSYINNTFGTVQFHMICTSAVSSCSWTFNTMWQGCLLLKKCKEDILYVRRCSKFII